MSILSGYATRLSDSFYAFFLMCRIEANGGLWRHGQAAVVGFL